jgi:CheY-like chemotaxis protein
LADFSVQGAVVLLVDDNEINLIAAGELLRNRGAKVDEAESGAMALGMCRSTHYNLIFIDYIMPGMDGRETAEAIRSSYGVNSSTPIIGLTADTSKETLALLIEAGVSAVLCKPADPGDLDRILLELLPDSLITRNSVAPSSTDHSGFARLADKITALGIDAPKALEVFAGNESSYMKVFRTFAVGLKITMDKMEIMFEQRYWNDLMISMHAMRSAAATVGATAISLMAKDIEAACRAQDEDQIDSLFPKFFDAIKAILEELPALQDEIDEHFILDRTRKGDSKFLLETLEKAIDLIEGLEHDEVMDALSRETSFDHGNIINPMLDELVEMVDSYRYSAACSQIQAILRLGGQT